MKSLFEKYKWLRIVLGAIILAAGVTSTILAIMGKGNIPQIIAIIVAICCFIYAALLITASFIKNTRTPYPPEIFVGGIIIGIGVTLCMKEVANAIADYVLYLVAYGLIALGVVAIIKAIVIICYKDPVQNWIFMLICGIIALVGGILLAANRDKVATAIQIVIAILIAVLGLFEIIIGITEISKSKKPKVKKE